MVTKKTIIKRVIYLLLILIPIISFLPKNVSASCSNDDDCDSGYYCRSSTGVCVDGNEGSGTANPSEALEVSGNADITGNITVSGNNIKDSTGTARVTFSSGDVIITLG